MYYILLYTVSLDIMNYVMSILDGNKIIVYYYRYDIKTYSIIRFP